MMIIIEIYSKKTKLLKGQYGIWSDQNSNYFISLLVYLGTIQWL